MKKIVYEVTKKRKGSWYDKDEKENEFFDWVTKQNAKMYDGKEDTSFTEGIDKTYEKDIWCCGSPNNRRVSIGVFYRIGQVDICWRMVMFTSQGSESTWCTFSEALQAKFYSMHF